MAEVRSPAEAPVTVRPGDAVPGLVWAYAFDDEGHGRAVSGADALKAIEAREGWVWLHLDLANQRGKEWVEDRAPIPESARTMMVDQDQHLMLVADDAALMGVFADFRRDFDQGTKEISRMRFVLYRRVLLTGRRQALTSVDEVRRTILQGHAFETGEALLERIFDNFADAVGAMTRELADTLEVIEDRVVEDRVDPDSVKLGPIRRTALRLNRQVGALRIHFHAFVENQERDLPDDVFAMAERVSLRLTSLGRDVEAIQERARILQEEFAVKVATDANQQLYTLSILTALFLPATLVTGLFGMNTKGLPFDAHEDGFWYAVMVCAFGSMLVYLILKRLGVTK